MLQLEGTLLIRDARSEDSGQYLCKVSNSKGEDSAETEILVTGKQFHNFFALLLLDSKCRVVQQSLFLFKRESVKIQLLVSFRYPLTYPALYP